MSTNRTPAVASGGQGHGQDRAGSHRPIIQFTTSRFGCQPPRGPGLPMFTTAGRCVAVVMGDTLTKTVSASRHFLRRPPGIAFDENILTNAERVGAVRVQVTDCDSGATYRATLADFDRHGLTIERGHGRQRALPLAHWTVERPGEAVQLALFEAVTP